MHVAQVRIKLCISRRRRVYKGVHIEEGFNDLFFNFYYIRINNTIIIIIIIPPSPLSGMSYRRVFRNL